MRRTNLTFGQNGDEVKPLTTNEIKPLSEDERRTLSHLHQYQECTFHCGRKHGALYTSYHCVFSTTKMEVCNLH